MAKTHLKGSNMFVREDFCKETLQQRAKLVPVVKAARLADHKCTIVGDNLILDGRRYRHDQLDKLPDHLSLVNVSTKANQNGHAFYGKQNPLSNFYPAIFTLNGIQFSSAEQCYQYHKAMFFKDDKTATDILKSNNPSAQKRLSRQIKDFCEATWEGMANDYMHNTLLAKFEQNKILLEALGSTGHKSLYEASPHDLYWGIGLSLSNKNVLNPDFHKGLNNLGNIMMSVREQLIKPTE
jgi:ribA/ribD-fused uncharacterized protein